MKPDMLGAETLGLRGAIVFLAVFVIYLALMVAYERRRMWYINDTFWFSLGIAMHWIGTLQAQFGIVGILPNFFYQSGMAFVIIAGILHIRAFTLASNRWLWKAAAFGAIVSGLSVYLAF